MRRRLFEIISPAKPGDRESKLFDKIIIVLIIFNVITITMSTFENTDERLVFFYNSVEQVSVIIFTVEYFLRVWTSDHIYENMSKTKARIVYIFSFMAIIDLVSILPFYLPFIIPMDLPVLHAMRVLRLLRVFKLQRYIRALDNVSIVWQRKSKIIYSSVSIIFLLIVITSIMIYHLEVAAQPEVFENAFSGFWWSVATFTTVGYGDIVPITVPGKIFSSIVAFLGLGLVAIPTGILSAGFVEIDNERHEKEHAEEHKNDKKCYCPYCGKNIE